MYLIREIGKVDIKIANYERLSDKELNRIFNIRKRLFIDTRKWNIESYDGGEIEMDKYDDSESFYIACYNDEEITGCLRLRPSCKDNLLTSVFRHLKKGTPIPKDHYNGLWEASRFCIIKRESVNRRLASNLDKRTIAMLIGMHLFAEIKDIKYYEIVIDKVMKKILYRSGWNPKIVNIGKGTFDETIYYGWLPCDIASRNSLYRKLSEQEQ